MFQKSGPEMALFRQKCAVRRRWIEHLGVRTVYYESSTYTPEIVAAKAIEYNTW